jgi:hypothetical protein
MSMLMSMLLFKKIIMSMFNEYVTLMSILIKYKTSETPN